jgi:chemotaxis signal transduction protein
MKPASRGGRIDWKEVHRRIARSEALLEEALTPVPRRVEEILGRRAARLARRPAEYSASPALRVMVLRLGEERYGIETKELAEVTPLTGCIAVPGSMPHILGVIQLRGELCAVASLCKLIGVAETGDGASSVVVFLRSAAGRIGLRMDGVEELLEVRPEELVPAEGKYLKGLIGKLMMLDVEAVVKEVYANEESAE